MGYFNTDSNIFILTLPYSKALLLRNLYENMLRMRFIMSKMFEMITQCDKYLVN